MPWIASPLSPAQLALPQAKREWLRLGAPPPLGACCVHQPLGMPSLHGMWMQFPGTLHALTPPPSAHITTTACGCIIRAPCTP